MNKIKTMFKKLTKPTLVGIVILAVTIIVIAFISWVFYRKTSQVLDTNLRERLLSIVTTAAVGFDPNDIEQLQVEDDWKKPEWAKVVHQMEKIRKNNSDIVFVYMLRKNNIDPTKMEFVSDSHSINPYAKIDVNNDGVINEEDQLNWPGQPYDVSNIPETFEAYNGPITNKDVYSDQWGTFLTGYAPIKDENGNTVAILATDIKANNFFTITRQTLQPFLIFIGFLLSISIISIFALIIIYSKALFKKLKKPTLFGIVILFISITIIVLTSLTLYNRTVDILTQNLRDRLLTISITQAANIDAKNLEALQTEEDWKKPEWARVVNRLHLAKYSNTDIVFMYIFRYTKDLNDDPKKMEFVVDADSIDPYANTSGVPSRYIDVNRDGKIEPDGPDKLQWPGQPYPEVVDIPEAYEAYNGPISVKDLYTDEYGTVLTGYAPIKDENGNTVAILATDIKANNFFTITRQTLQPFLIFIGFLSSIISILILIVIYSGKKYNKYLRETNAKLEIMNKLKTEFLSLATHQLRSPITAIKGYSSMLLDGSYGSVVETQKDPVDKIFKSSDRMNHMITRFLDVAKMEQGGMQYAMQIFGLEKIAEEIVNELSVTAKEKGLTMTFETDNKSPYMVNGDKEQLWQVIQNLVDNAMKYTKEGWIKVKLSKDEKRNKIILAVSDSGMGIKSAIMPELFHRFSRGEGARMNTTGSGIGLFLARKIIEKGHNGRIWAQSDGENKGSTFIFELPTA